MKYYLTKEAAYKIDEFFIKEINIPSQILMENAAHSTFNSILQIPEINRVNNILLLCGSGNNGGDGFALARYLSNHFNVDIYFDSEIKNMSEETLVNYNICKKLGISFVESIEDNYDLIIESLVGIGVDENINSKLSNLLNKVNKIDALKIAIDNPAGLNVNTGIASQDAFIADYTVTMFAEKIGLIINDGPKVSGKIIAVNLGTPERYVRNFTNYKSLEEIDTIALHKPRKDNTSKFDYGRIAIIAGSKDMLGAGALAANAAIKAGAGLVHLISTGRHSQLLPEVICQTFEENKYGSLALKSLNEILEITEKADTIAIGPGISNDENVLHLIQKIIEENQNKKLILDADALKCIDSNSILSNNFIITPHIGEFSNIINIDRTIADINRINEVEKWSKKLNCTVLLKGYPTLISDGNEVYINRTGNSGLATAGSGDVLTGILSAIYSRYDDPLVSAALASYIHGKIADNYIINYSKSSLTASKIIELLNNYEI